MAWEFIENSFLCRSHVNTYCAHRNLSFSSIINRNMHLNTVTLLSIFFSCCSFVQPLDLQPQLRGAENINIFSAEQDGFVDKLAALRDHFVAWKKKHSKSYSSFSEEVQRMLIWIDNHEFINNHNNQSPKPKFMLGHNQFSDLRNSEYRERLSKGSEEIYLRLKDKLLMDKLGTMDQKGNGALAESRRLRSEPKQGELPQYVNWVESGAVTPVKNQGNCGACWAFSATGAIEGAKFIKDGVLVSLSEQNLVDCDTYQDHGCEGGLMEFAFKFDETSDGLCSEADYPYLAADGDTCNSDQCEKVQGTQVKDYVDVPEGDLDGLLALIAKQPTSIAVQADQMYFQLYQSGILDDDDCGAEGNVDHGVLAVGYGQDEETGERYILIKNSWGDSWGDQGFIKMKADSSNPYGMCAMLRIMTAPILA